MEEVMPANASTHDHGFTSEWNPPAKRRILRPRYYWGDGASGWSWVVAQFWWAKWAACSRLTFIEIFDPLYGKCLSNR